MGPFHPLQPLDHGPGKGVGSWKRLGIHSHVLCAARAWVLWESRGELWCPCAEPGQCLPCRPQFPLSRRSSTSRALWISSTRPSSWPRCVPAVWDWGLPTPQLGPGLPGWQEGDWDKFRRLSCLQASPFPAGARREVPGRLRERSDSNSHSQFHRASLKPCRKL